MNISKIIIQRTLVILFYSLILFKSLNGQPNISTEIKAVHLDYNNIGGIKYAVGFEYHIDKNAIILNSHMIYAVGNRDFVNVDGELYTLVDGANRQDYPLPGIVPGLEESAYIKALKLNTAKTMDVGFEISYGRIISEAKKHKVRMDIGINFSWIEESSIRYSYKGDLTNILGTSENIYLVAPYSQNFFDLGPILAVNYAFISQKKTSFGISADVAWLTQTGFKFSFGPTFCVRL